MSVLENAQALQAMAGQGQLIEAVEKFYADDVTIVEATGETFHGKETQKKRTQEWLESREAIHGGGVTAITANEEDQVSCVESWVDVTFQGHRMKFEEVAVQKWKDGKVVHERFYYNAPNM